MKHINTWATPEEIREDLEMVISGLAELAEMHPSSGIEDAIASLNEWMVAAAVPLPMLELDFELAVKVRISRGALSRMDDIDDIVARLSNALMDKFDDGHDVFEVLDVGPVVPF